MPSYRNQPTPRLVFHLGMPVLRSLVLALVVSLLALAAGQKLVLKDGSYQLVRSYQLLDDRVRYFSLERNQWEEMPASLVDWKATEERNQKEQAEVLQKAREAATPDRSPLADEPGFEIAPGLHLPDKDGLFVVENGKVRELPQHQASVRTDKGRMLTNILLPVPLLKHRTLVEIPGARATLQLEKSPQALFASGRTRGDSRYALLRLKPKGDKRRVEAILLRVFSGKPTHAGDSIPLTVETVTLNVFRLVPQEPLRPGEYAVVEFLGNDLNLFLWDFGVRKQHESRGTQQEAGS